MKTIFLTLLLVICASQGTLGQHNFPINENGAFQLPMNYELDPIQQRGLNEYLQAVIQRAIDAARQAFQKLTNQINEVLSKIVNAIAEIEQNAINAISILLEQIHQQIGDLQHIGECYREHADELKNISIEARTSIKQCVANASSQLSELHDSLSPHKDSIEDELDEIRNIVASCSNSNPIEAIRCVINNIEALSSSVNDIIALVRNAISEALPQIKDIRQNAHECIHAAQQIAHNKTELVIEQIKDCIANNNSTQLHKI